MNKHQLRFEGRLPSLLFRLNFRHLPTSSVLLQRAIEKRGFDGDRGGTFLDLDSSTETKCSRQASESSSLLLGELRSGRNAGNSQGFPVIVSLRLFDVGNRAGVKSFVVGGSVRVRRGDEGDSDGGWEKFSFRGTVVWSERGRNDEIEVEHLKEGSDLE